MLEHADASAISVLPLHPKRRCRRDRKGGHGNEEIPEIAMTSPTAPGVTHRWSDMKAYTDEVANARIWAGFHYRFSTRVGTRMGYQVGEYVVRTVMQPIATTLR